MNLPAIGSQIRLSRRGPSGTVKAHFVADLHGLGEETFLVMGLDAQHRGYIASEYGPAIFVSVLVVHPDSIYQERNFDV